MDVEELVAEHGTWMLRLAYLLTADRVAADDLYQDALLKVLTNPDRVAAARHQKAYLRRILINSHIDSTRRLASAAENHPMLAPLTVAGSFADDVELRSQMWQVIGMLTPPLRTALVLRYYEDLDDAEIASILGWSRSTVRSNVSRALNQLRKSWDTPDSLDEVRQ